MRKYIFVATLILCVGLSLLPSTALSVGRADIIIRGGTVVTMDGSSRVIENGAVSVKGERIVAVGTARGCRGCRNSDYQRLRKVIMPGLISLLHMPMVLFRVADDLLLMEWLREYIFPAEAKNVDEQFVDGVRGSDA